MEMSAILIINNAQSAVDILAVIARNSRIFARHPIQVLRNDDARSQSTIAQLVAQYNIRKVPVLIGTDNTITIGVARICALLDKFAQSLAYFDSRTRARPARHVPADEGELHEYQLSMCQQSDADEDDADTAKTSAEGRQKEIQQRVARAKARESYARHTPSTSSSAESDDEIVPRKEEPQRVPIPRRAGTGAPPRAPASSQCAPAGISQAEDAFEARLMEGAD
jgi:hypothetical protein